MTSNKTPAMNPFDVFHPVEHSIIAHWLSVEPPSGCPEFDSLPADDEPDHHVGLVWSHGTYDEKTATENAVARIALRGMEDSFNLPQWAACFGDGTIVYGRDRSRAPGGSTNLALLPRFLFMINWADSGPGFSWPESYHLTWFPWYDRFVVTASQDSTDVYGYTDIAYGHFGAGRPLLDELEELFVKNWGALCGYGQCWEHFWDPGLVQEHDAVGWALKVAWSMGFPDNWFDRHGVPDPELEEDYEEEETS